MFKDFRDEFKPDMIEIKIWIKISYNLYMRIGNNSDLIKSIFKNWRVHISTYLRIETDSDLI